jgi:ATP-binding cassette subfamily B protein
VGVSLLAISDAAEKICFRTQGCKITFNQLKKIELPCILHWNDDHFVVLYKIKKDVVYISDPAIGLITYSKSEFQSRWERYVIHDNSMGAALLLAPTPNFYDQEPEKEKKLSLFFLVNYIKPYKRLIFQLFLSLLAGTILSLIFPFLTQSLVDIGINTRNHDFVVLILVSQIVLTISQTAAGFLRSWIMLYFSARIGISLVSDFLIKLMRLPIKFFDSRLVGDISQRIADNSRIQSFLTGNLITFSFGLLNFVIYSVILAYYYWKILVIFYVGSFIYFGWIVLFLKRRKKLDYKSFTERSSNQNSVYQLLTGMQEIKLNNCEKQKRWEWERIQANLFKLQIKALTLSQTQSVGSFLINQIKNIMISYITAKAVIDGNLTLGMMMSIQYMLGQLNGPINDFISFTQSSQDANISLERLGEVYNKPDEDDNSEQKIFSLPVNKDIELADLTFYYEGPRSPVILNKLTLIIPENKVTAIVGASGSGKSTLMKILLGFYDQFEGKATIGGFDLNQYNLDMWRSRCGTVSQDGFIFSDTIANNIALGEDTPDIEKLAYAVKMANIEEFITGLPHKYNTKIGPEGVGVSQGQKQRILLARAVYKDPDYLFLDEATNALDANNEKVIIENLNDFFVGKTVVIIAHRLSTIKSADKIVVLDKGKIVETGDHDELYRLKGNYYNLVKNQLSLGG